MDPITIEALMVLINKNIEVIQMNERIIYALVRVTELQHRAIELLNGMASPKDQS